MKNKIVYLIGIFILMSMNLKAGNDIIHLDKNILHASEAVSYQWYFSGQELKGVKGSEIRAMSSGIYTVKMETADGRILSETVNVNLETGKIQRIHLVGDSTMADYSLRSAYMENYYPLTGWGQVFQQFMHADSLGKVNHFIDADSIEVIDWAIGGRSTKVFYEEGTWNNVYNAIQPGDYVFIQFGHNDASVSHPDRYIDTAGFKGYLKLFAEQTREKGGIPVFITPVNRNYPWSGGVLTSVHGDYTPATILAADESNTACIDLTERSCEFFTSKGQDYVTNNYFNNCDPGEYPAYPDGNSDGTHFNTEGGIEVARMVYKGLQDLRSLNITMTDEAAGRIAGSRWHDTKFTAALEIPVYANRGWVFENWSGDITSSDNPLILNLTEDMSITANFRTSSKNQYTVSTSVEGSGTISVSPFGDLHEDGSTVSLTSIPFSNKVFYSWTGDLIDTTSTLEFEIEKDSEFLGVFVENTATIYQPEWATLSNCLMSSDLYNQTGDNCIKIAKNTECSVEWDVIPEEENYLKFYLRYSNKFDSAATVNLYINGELNKENVKLPVSGPEESWSTVRIGAKTLPHAINTIKFEFDNISEDIHIDFIKVVCTVNLLDTYTTVIDAALKSLEIKIFPNPTSSSSKIVFNLDENHETSVEIFNLSGQKYLTLFDGYLDAGSHELTLNKGKLEPGLYICYITSNKGCSTEKLLVQ